MYIYMLSGSFPPGGGLGAATFTYIYIYIFSNDPVKELEL